MYYQPAEKAPHSKFRKKSQRLLQLSEVIQIVPPEKTEKTIVKLIDVDKIIGTENRSNDFGEDFLPLYSWMDERWLLIKQLYGTQDFDEPIRVYEYGSYYFVRDGHHRVSVAKAEDIKTINAEVMPLKIPIRLCPNMNRRKLAVFREKYQFFLRNHVFDLIPEENFDVNRPATWRSIEYYIFDVYREMMTEIEGNKPGKKRLILDWNINVYERNIAEIRDLHMEELYPGYGLTDIFVELMDYAHSHPVWINQAYGGLIRERAGAKPVRFLSYQLHHLRDSLQSSEQKERYKFLWISRLKKFRPQSRLPSGSKKWYRFLTNHLLDYYQYHFKKKFGKNPSMDELVTTWYDDWLLPAIERYEELKIDIPFPEFYRNWMKIWEKKCSEGNVISFKKSLKMYLKQIKNENEPDESEK